MSEKTAIEFYNEDVRGTYTLADLEQARKQGAEDEKAPVLPGSRLAQCGQASEEKEDAPPLGRLPRGEGRRKMSEMEKQVIREALDLIREALESCPVDLDTIKEQARLILKYEKEARP